MLYQMEPKPTDIIQQPSLSICVDRFYGQYISELLIKIIIIITIVIIIITTKITIRIEGEEEEEEEVELLLYQKC